MFGLQPIHLVLILIIALIIFGPKRLPELGGALGKSINEFRNATRDVFDPANPSTPEQTHVPAPTSPDGHQDAVVAGEAQHKE